MVTVVFQHGERQYQKVTFVGHGRQGKELIYTELPLERQQRKAIRALLETS